jgi:iron complex outermembrane receptor protein
MKNLKGNRQIFTPSYTQQLSAQYTFPIVSKKEINGLVRFEYLALGKQYFDVTNTIVQDGYSLLNTKFGIQSSKLSLYGWFRNISNTKYISYGYDFGGVGLGNTSTSGITLGVKL